jgi:hypothetical protein
VEISVTDLRPGRNAISWWVGSGDERAWIEARVEVAGHGGFVIETGRARGRFEGLLEDLGKKAAKQIAASRG